MEDTYLVRNDAMMYFFFQPCGAAGRRRRDVTEETEEEAVMTIRVYDPNKTEASTGIKSFAFSSIIRKIIA